MPESVVKGMLAGIGISIIRTQVPVAIGAEMGVAKAFADFDPGPLVLAVISLSVFAAYAWIPEKRRTLVPAKVVVVVLGALLARAFASYPALALRSEHFVRLPVGGWAAVRLELPVPTPADFALPRVWMVAFTIAIVASIESLVTLRAIDGMDPLARRSPPDRDLVAQGLANLTCSWLGGIPVTASAARSFANVQAGARERLASMVQGALLLAALLFGARLMNLIPLASLAALLISVGSRLASVKVFVEQWREGWGGFVPYLGTLLGVMSTDLLNGVVLGIALELVRRGFPERHGPPPERHGN
ncbi:MAG: SulP family inorganic anion transporter [Alphaproteobacteria bacterium]